MGFRFPHPAENIGSAVRDVFNPDTPADGSLVEQLMNENNRAVEDAIDAIDAAPLLNSPLVFQESTSGTFSGVYDSLSLPFTLPFGGTWILNGSVQLSGEAMVDEGDLAAIELQLDDDHGHQVGRPVRDPIAVPIHTDGVYVTLSVERTVSAIYGEGWSVPDGTLDLVLRCQSTGNADFNSAPVSLVIQGVRIGGFPDVA